MRSSSKKIHHENINLKNNKYYNIKLTSITIITYIIYILKIKLLIITTYMKTYKKNNIHENKI